MSEGCDIIDLKGKKVETLELDPALFSEEERPGIVHQVVRWQLAKRRAGTHATLNRSRMTSGGRKPFKQKGSGRARAGTRRSPLWVGGAVIHGPQPRKYEFSVPKKVKRKALASVLSAKKRGGLLVGVSELKNESGKTRDLVSALEGIGVGDYAKKGGVLLLVDEKDESLWRSSKNLKNVKPLLVSGLNVYDLLKFRCLVATKGALLSLQGKN